MKRPHTPAPTGGAQKATHNDADIAFAQEMVPHHQQALEMAELAASRATAGKVKDLADRIKQPIGNESRIHGHVRTRNGSRVQAGHDDRRRDAAP